MTENRINAKSGALLQIQVTQVGIPVRAFYRFCNANPPCHLPPVSLPQPDVLLAPWEGEAPAKPNVSVQ
jgi:hypothetical protein